MIMKRKRVVIIASVAVFMAIALYRPKRNFVIEVEGPPNRNFDAVFVLDGQRQTETVTLPATFTFHAREVAYDVAPSDPVTDHQISGHMYLENESIDFACEARSVGGFISASRTDIWPAPSLNWLMNSRKTVYTNRENALNPRERSVKCIL